MMLAFIRDNINCSLQSQCLKSNIIYQADVSNNMDNETMNHRSKRDIATMYEMENMKDKTMQLILQIIFNREVISN